MTFGEAPTVGRGLVLVNSRAIDIPAGESHYVVKTGITIPQDVELLGITPHAHYLAKDMKVDAHLPDGTVTPLIWIKDWDFNWQGQYRYADRIKLPKGTRVELEYTYDNSAGNPRNPSSPPVRVHWGEQTKDEMALAFLSVVLPSPADEAAFQRAIGIEALTEFFQQTDDVNVLPQEISPAQRDRLKLAIALFDRNHDGKLDAEERKALIDFTRGSGCNNSDNQWPIFGAGWRSSRSALFPLLFSESSARSCTLPALRNETRSKWRAVWARSMLFFGGIKVEVEGLEKIDPNGRYVFASNHLSYIDTPVVFSRIPVQFRFLAKSGLFKIPFLGWHLKDAGHISVPLEEPHGALRTLSSAAASD